MHARMLVDPGPIPGIPKGPLHRRIRRMPACQTATFTPRTQHRRRKDEPPGQRSRSRGIFASERTWKWGQPGPCDKSCVCSSATRSNCCLSGACSRSGSSVVRSLPPFPERTFSTPPEKSMSLTRSVMHSLTRKPEPYINSAISLTTPVICSRIAFTSSRERTTGTRWRRCTRFVILAKVDDASAEAVLEGFSRRLRTLPMALRKTLTYDQGREMARHEELEKRTHLRVYFADPHSPWQRPTNENTNGLLRQYFPKGTDLSQYSQQYLTKVAEEMNNRPRKSLGFRTPAEVMAQKIKELNGSVALQN